MAPGLERLRERADRLDEVEARQNKILRQKLTFERAGRQRGKRGFLVVVGFFRSRVVGCTGSAMASRSGPFIAFERCDHVRCCLCCCLC